MSTAVTIEVVRPDTPDVQRAIDRAFEWFRRVEACCSRFDPASELTQLSTHAGIAVEASPMLYEAVQFAVAVAEETGGAFDPTVGRAMVARGFNREYSTGRVAPPPAAIADAVTFRDIDLDPSRRTITLRRPMLLDLGAVAKGLAIDTAARELHALEDFAIDAGGDLCLQGRNPDGDPWSVGIRHPRLQDQMIETLRVTNCAVCTSGDYERRGATGAGGHILDARTGQSADEVASVTVVASTAMLADALATAAFALGPADGLDLLTRNAVDGLIVSTSMARHQTPGFSRA